MQAAETTSTKPATLEQHRVDQHWETYSAEQHSVWQLLYERRMAELREVACREFLSGAKAIGLAAASIPDLREMNGRLAPRTGWSAVPVDGFLEAGLFFHCLAERRFPTTVILRRRDQLEYLPEPDIFHDVFGHVPMHADAVFADFLQRFGQIASRARNENERRALTRLFWFTVEFGLIREEGKVKVYGSGLISSSADCRQALSRDCERRPFSLYEVLRQEFAIDNLQPLLFVVDSTAQLFAAVAETERMLDAGELA